MKMLIQGSGTQIPGARTTRISFDVGKVQKFLDAVAGRELLKQLQKEHPSVAFEYRLQNRIRRRTNGRYFNKIRVDASVGAFDTLLIVAVVLTIVSWLMVMQPPQTPALYVDPPETVIFPDRTSHCESIRALRPFYVDDTY